MRIGLSLSICAPVPAFESGGEALLDESGNSILDEAGSPMEPDA